MTHMSRIIAAFTLVALLMPGVGEPAQSLSVTRKTLTISGSVGVPGATMQGLPDNPASDENGVYSARVSYGWSGAVTPVKLGYRFEPPKRTYTSVEADFQDEDYKAGIVTFIISGRVGLPGVRLQGLPDSPLSNQDGSYSAKVPFRWAGIVVPTRDGYRFDPPQRTYDPMTADQDNEDYVTQPLTFTIAGKVGLAGVVMLGLPGNVVSDNNGFYRVEVPHGWSGKVTPEKVGYVFEPPAKEYDSVIADLQNEDYRPMIKTFIISGNVKLPDVTLQGLPNDPISDMNGAYSVKVPYGWTGRVTPVLDGFSFDPPSRTYHRIDRDCSQEDYTPKAITIRIAGTVGMHGVTMEGLPGYVTSVPPTGRYQAEVPYGWSGKVTPKKDGFHFEPVCREYRRLTADRPGDDYRGLPETVVISDIVLMEPEGPLEGVTVRAEPGNATAVTDVEGRFVIRVPYGWSGRLKLSKEGYEFSGLIQYTNVREHIVDGKRMPVSQEPVIPVPRTSAMRPQPVAPGGTGDVLVIPTTQVNPAQFAETSEDMRVMLHILREKLSEPRMIMGVLYDYGDFFSGDQSLEAVYLQGYGALFVMQSDLPFALPSESPAPGGTPEAKAVDPVWQRARQRLYAPPNATRYAGGRPGESREMNFEEFREDLLRTLRHATNIRHLDPNEYVIVTIMARDRGTGRAEGPAGSSFSSRGGGWFGGGSYSVSGGSYGAGGGSSYVDSRSYSRGSTSSQPGAPALDSYGKPRLGTVPAGTPSPPAAGILTIQARKADIDAQGRPIQSRTAPSPAAGILTVQVRKADIDAFAQGTVDFEQFQQRVKTFTY